LRIAALWMLGLAALFVFLQLARGHAEPRLSWSYSEFRSAVVDDRVDSVTVKGEQITGHLEKPVDKKVDGG
jgi:hypothetical protein